MKIERLISCFDKISEELIEEKNIDHISLDKLREIFKPNMANDPLMYNPYTIYAQQAKELEKITDMHFNLDVFFYQIDCFQAK